MMAVDVMSAVVCSANYAAALQVWQRWEPLRARSGDGGELHYCKQRRYLVIVQGQAWYI